MKQEEATESKGKKIIKKVYANTQEKWQEERDKERYRKKTMYKCRTN